MSNNENFIYDNEDLNITYLLAERPILRPNL